jgi:hypothetical protein
VILGRRGPHYLSALVAIELSIRGTFLEPFETPGAAVPFSRRRAIELSIRGTFLGPFETPAGVIQPTGAKLDIPAADFWYMRDGKI